jgi:hypothetical protein
VAVAEDVRVAANVVDWLPVWDGLPDPVAVLVTVKLREAELLRAPLHVADGVPVMVCVRLGEYEKVVVGAYVALSEGLLLRERVLTSVADQLPEGEFERLRR